MKKIILVLLFCIISGVSDAQIKQRTMSQNVYTGIGFKFILLTDPQASDAYPFFQFSSGDFLKEIDGYLGVTFNEKYGIEFSPGYLFSNALNSDGFYFDGESGRNFYVPAQTRLFAVPLNVRFKFYPFSEIIGSSFSKMYFGIGGGTIYISEEVTSQIYTSEGQNYLGIRTASNSFWTGDYEFMIGTGSFSKIGFGFELSYRFVPLNNNDKSPLITYLASNFNSVNLAGNIIFSF